MRSTVEAALDAILAGVGGADQEILTLVEVIDRAMPHTEQAVRDGKLPLAKARVLASAVNDRTRDTFAEHSTRPERPRSPG